MSNLYEGERYIKRRLLPNARDGVNRGTTLINNYLFTQSDLRKTNVIRAIVHSVTGMNRSSYCLKRFQSTAPGRA